jgi:hypothetical protein
MAVRQYSGYCVRSRREEPAAILDAADRQGGT